MHLWEGHGDSVGSVGCAGMAVKMLQPLLGQTLNKIMFDNDMWGILSQPGKDATSDAYPCLGHAACNRCKHKNILAFLLSKHPTAQLEGRRLTILKGSWHETWRLSCWQHFEHECAHWQKIDSTLLLQSYVAMHMSAVGILRKLVCLYNKKAIANTATIRGRRP